MMETKEFTQEDNTQVVDVVVLKVDSPNTWIVQENS